MNLTNLQDTPAQRTSVSQLTEFYTNVRLASFLLF